jgi:pilus assembly protein CpaB
VENISPSRLFRTRQGTLVLGVLAAVLAAIALIVYLNQYRNSVNNTAQPLSVLVAKSLIPQGTSGHVVASSSLYKITSIPKTEAQAGVFVDPSTLAGRVALQDIYPGQQLTDADFGVAPSTVSDQLTPDQRAVVVPLDSPSEVDGQIGTGDRVDVWALLPASGGSTVAREILQNMYVMSTDGGNVTIRAKSRQAGMLILASHNATIWLTLRPTNGSVTKPPVITPKTLLGH